MARPVFAWEDLRTDTYAVQWSDGKTSTITRKALVEHHLEPERIVRQFIPEIKRQLSPFELFEAKMKGRWGEHFRGVDYKIVSRQLGENLEYEHSDRNVPISQLLLASV